MKPVLRQKRVFSTKPFSWQKRVFVELQLGHVIIGMIPATPSMHENHAFDHKKIVRIQEVNILMWQSLLVYNACPQPQTEATVLVSPSLLQIDTFGKWCRCLHNVCYVKLKKRRYLDKCRLSAPAGISALMSLLTNFFFAMCCSRQPFSIYLFRTNAFKFVYFFANVTNCYS